jgi:hypothetical protein
LNIRKRERERKKESLFNEIPDSSSRNTWSLIQLKSDSNCEGEIRWKGIKDDESQQTWREFLSGNSIKQVLIDILFGVDNRQYSLLSRWTSRVSSVTSCDLEWDMKNESHISFLVWFSVNLSTRKTLSLWLHPLLVDMIVRHTHESMKRDMKGNLGIGYKLLPSREVFPCLLVEKKWGKTSTMMTTTRFAFHYVFSSSIHSCIHFSTVDWLPFSTSYGNKRNFCQEDNSDCDSLSRNAGGNMKRLKEEKLKSQVKKTERTQR